ncbi:MAG: YciI family protein [Devosia sp.]
MHYLCLVYAQDAAAGSTQVPEDTIKDHFIEMDHKLFLEGKVILASPLQGPQTAVSIRYSNGKRSRTDGPFVETKEHIAGFLVISADSLDEAVAIASEGDLANFANYEIRPLLDEKHSRTGQDRSFFFRR